MKSFSIGALEIKLPIIQGGMGVGVSMSGLASAVANEGGIGVISCAGVGLLYPNSARDYISNCIFGLKEELRKAREKSKGVIGVNIMMALSNYGDMARTAIAEKVDVIFAGAGLPMDLPSFLEKDSQTKLVPIVSSARAAKLICDKWLKNYNYLPDAIVVEGPQAGGHLGYKKEQLEDEAFSLEKILPQVIAVAAEYKDMKDTPVIAAGGIMTGEDIDKFISMGASGVQMASIFVPTVECDASDTFKQCYISSSKEDMRIIESPVGLPGRALNGEFLKRVKEGLTRPKSCSYNCLRTCDYTNTPYCIMKALFFAAKGHLDKGFVFAGANAYMAEKIRTVAEVIAQLKEEYSKVAKKD